MPLSFGGVGLCEKTLWILITFIDYITRHSFRGYTHISRSQHDTHRYTSAPDYSYESLLYRITRLIWGCMGYHIKAYLQHLYNPLY